MVSDFVQWVIAGLAAPQPTVRRLLDEGHGIDVAILLFALGYLLEAMAVTVFGARLGSGPLIAAHMAGIIQGALFFMITAFLVHRLGKLSGGTGSFSETLVGMGWFTMMSGLFAPVMVAFSARVLPMLAPPTGQVDEFATMPDVPTYLLLAVTCVMMVMVWLFANMIAALHGFRSIWGVIGVVVGIPFAIVMMTVTLSGGGV